MASDGKGDVRATKPVAKLRPFARALHHIGQGKPERIDLHGVAADIHKRGTAGLPGPLELWLCDYLEGNIETRGRKGESALERRLIGRYVSHYYDAIRKAQKGDPDTLPEAVISYQQYASKCSDSYSPSEAAWKIVSWILCDQPGHHKTLRNLAGAAKSKPEKPARK